ncbi:PilN domain-containing protein [Alkalibacillus aidingensis]|uniref:PilN domain-containing protein n=1 Tax=Alkalibacillus aidingensis TaxID=2747607 RepID=UPI001660B19D|nr:hypothetical protein [Alkalibacillus aidingensis]
MLVDINLLPKKEKNRTPFWIYFTLSLFTFVVVTGAGYLVWDLNQQQQTLSDRLQQTERTNAILQAELEGDEEYQRAEALAQLIEELDGGFSNTTAMMSRIIDAIPSGGMLISFRLDELTIDLTIQTNTNEQAVSYYQALRALDGLNDVTIHTINYNENEDHYVTSYTVNLETEEVES